MDCALKTLNAVNQRCILRLRGKHLRRVRGLFDYLLISPKSD